MEIVAGEQSCYTLLAFIALKMELHWRPNPLGKEFDPAHTMPNYRPAWHPGATYFFTVNTLRRRGCTLLTDHSDFLRAAVRTVRRVHPFRIHGWVVLPDHLHAVLGQAVGQIRGHGGLFQRQNRQVLQKFHGRSFQHIFFPCS